MLKALAAGHLPAPGSPNEAGVAVVKVPDERLDRLAELVQAKKTTYLEERILDFPSFSVQTVKGTPCTHNPLGVKGCGEAGAIGSPPALINAICNALGVKDVPMPASPYNVWKAAQAAAR